MNNGYHILLVEDNPGDAGLVEKYLTSSGQSGIQIDSADTLVRALELIDEDRFDVVLLDLNLPDSTGFDTFERVHEKAPQLPVIIMTGLDDEASSIRAVGLGAQDYLVKGDVDGKMLLHSVKYAIERRKTWQRLQDNRGKYRSLFNSIRDAILITDTDHQITDCNTAFENLFEYRKEEALGKTIKLLIADKASFLRMGAALQAHDEDSSHVTVLNFKTKSGRKFQGEAGISSLTDPNGRKTGYITLIRDTSEKRQLEAQLRQAQKMEAVGSLAGGIAHDFNNLLTIIIGNLDFALMDMEADDPLRPDMQEIMAAADRAQELTRQLLLYSRKGTRDLQPSDLNEIVKQLLKLMQRLIGEDVAIHTELSADLRMIKADRTNMEQLFMNLMVNARDAMPDGGQITIATENMVVDAAYVERYPYARPGNYVKISLADTGCGMEKETLERVFEPFFTTKELPDKKGTGLGLSVVYGIVKAHEGWVNVFSTPGTGTEFQIFLPAMEAGKVEQMSSEAEGADDLQGNGERILIVEDEPSVSRTVQRILDKMGYQTIAAETAEQARQIFDRESGGFDLLFTDTILPDINGLELARRLKRIRPELKVLVGSGYTGDKVSQETIRKEGFPFIQKPYSMTRLLSTIKTTIND